MGRRNDSGGLSPERSPWKHKPFTSTMNHQNRPGFPSRKSCVRTLSPFLGSLLLFSALQLRAQEPVLQIGEDISVRINKQGAIQDITAFGTPVVEDKIAGGRLTGNPSPAEFRDSALHQAWDWVKGNKAVFENKPDEIRVAGELVPRGAQDSANSCGFLISYKKVREGVFAISVEVTYQAGGAWALPLFYRLHFPANELAGASIDVVDGNGDGKTFVVEAAASDFKCNDAGEIKIGAGDWTLDCKADDTTQMALKDGRRWNEDTIVIDIGSRVPPKKTHSFEQGQKVTFGSTLDFKKK